MAWTDYAGGGVAGGVSGIGNMISSFLHPERGYKKAGNELQKYWNEAKGYQMPFMQHGLDQYGNLMNAENRLLNPADLENEWAKGYEMSPYAKMLMEQNIGQGRDEASAQGLIGSSAALNNIQQGAGMITAQDRRQYLQDLMEKYMKGVGLGSDIYGVGANAAGNLSSGAQNVGQNMAGLAYGQQAAPGQLFGKLLGAGTTAAMNYAMPGSGVVMNGSNSAGNLYNSSNNFNQ